MGASMNTRTWLRLLLPIPAILALLACQSVNKLSIRRNRDEQELTAYRIRSLTGLRDGDKLGIELVVADRQDTLTMQMKFQIGVPPTLEAGNYVWLRKYVPPIQGVIKANAVTFQGNQNGPPSLGGTFQLVSDDVDLYQVKMPATLMDPPGRSPASAK